MYLDERVCVNRNQLIRFIIIRRSDDLVRLLRYILIFFIFLCQILSLHFPAYLVLYLLYQLHEYFCLLLYDKLPRESRIYKKNCTKDAIKDDRDLTFAWNSTSINGIDRVSF